MHAATKTQTAPYKQYVIAHCEYNIGAKKLKGMHYKKVVVLINILFNYNWSDKNPCNTGILPDVWEYVTNYSNPYTKSQLITKI